MNNELWGKEIIRARGYIAKKHFADAEIILEQLLLNENEACVADAKKLLVKISLIEKTNIDSSITYCRDILNERLDIKYLQYLIELGSVSSTLKGHLSFIMDLKKNLNKPSSVTINLQLIHALVSLNKEVNSTVTDLLGEIISIYREVEILDDNFLYMRKYPSFSIFIELLKDIQDLVPSFELASYIEDNLSWIDETGKQILQENGFV